MKLRTKARRPAKGRFRARPVKRPARATNSILTKEVPVEAIDWSGSIRPLDVEHVERLSGAERLPPVKVWEYQAGRYRGIDGFHRWRVTTDRGDKVVQATVYHFPQNEQGERAFELQCVIDNLQHGLPLTRAQRDQVISRLWNRWGRPGTISRGTLTLEQLAKLFNLTRPRIHQIVSSHLLGGDKTNGSGASIHDIGAVSDLRRISRGSPRHFSDFARFSAATRRLSKLLSDVELIRDLVDTRNSDVLSALVSLRERIDEVCTSFPRAHAG